MTLTSKDLKKRAEIIAKICNQSLDNPENDKNFFTELIDDEFLRNDINFEEALGEVSSKRTFIKSQLSEVCKNEGIEVDEFLKWIIAHDK